MSLAYRACCRSPDGADGFSKISECNTSCQRIPFQVRMFPLNQIKLLEIDTLLPAQMYHAEANSKRYSYLFLLALIPNGISVLRMIILSKRGQMHVQIRVVW
jgi:hypothetical protein